MNIPNWIHSLLFDRKYKVLKHLLFWVFIYADELLSFIDITAPLEVGFLPVVTEILGDMAFVYINLYYLLPRFFYQGKVVQYVLYTIMTILLIVGYNQLVFPIEYDPVDMISLIIASIIVNAGMLFMAVALKLISQWHNDNAQIMELREENLKTELAYLKTQVNPHFLFNTLNNVYVMSKKKDDNVPETIMQLSELLRYQLYECSGDSVPLKNEVNYLKNYIKLEQLRRDSLEVVFDLRVTDTNMSIRPLIFLPFVENSFKYSNTNSGTDKIVITIESKENILIFRCKNNKGTLHSGVSGGIGLENASRRLELSYPESHTLTINDGNDHFEVLVEITNP